MPDARADAGDNVGSDVHADAYAVIGAGPSGLAGARNLQRLGVPFVGFESHADVGGLWDIENPRSTVYESAHLISSKRMTEFREFPMAADVADYPSHRELREYFRAFARRFDLYRHYRFNATVKRVEPERDGWRVTLEDGESHRFAGVLIANGTLATPKIPEFEGEFAGELIHSAQYKTPSIFEGRRVLIVGAGNSGCDLAVDAAHRARRVAISVRRGYHFVPKYVLGRPADAIGGRLRLPRRLKQRVDAALLKFLVGDPRAFGFPEPDHRLYESHPIVNSLILHHIGHGDVEVMADIERFDGDRVVFKDGRAEAFDLVVLATGYRLDYPFIDREHLCWDGPAPRLYLNTFHPTRDDLFVLGMVEAAGIGWQGRYEQAELVARFIDGLRRGSAAAERLRREKSGPPPDLSGGYRYMKLDRMAYYVHKDTFLAEVRRHIRRFERERRG